MTSIRRLARERLLVLGVGALIAALSFVATAGGSSGSEPGPQGRLVIADSKKLYKPRGPLAALERGTVRRSIVRPLVVSVRPLGGPA